mgnify:CR=1 FL=1
MQPGCGNPGCACMCARQAHVLTACSGSAKLGLSAAPGLMNLVIRFQYNQVSVVSYANHSFAVIQSQAAGRIDGAGVDCVEVGA